jgi:hypothetical protein
MIASESTHAISDNVLFPLPFLAAEFEIPDEWWR